MNLTGDIISEKNNLSPGMLIWITGLPGAGKTIFARKLLEEVKSFISTVVQIDGDAIREIAGDDLGYTVEDRKKNAYRIARLNKYLIEQGLTVICSTVSLYSEIHQWNKENIYSLIEIFIEVPHEILRIRDKKGLYSQVDRDVIGIHQDYEVPKQPTLVILNDGDLNSFLDKTQEVLKYVIKQKKS